MFQKRIVLLLVYCLYAGLFIYQTSFVIDGERFFSLFDDGMISMRYAKNLADGYGLVWNPGGERIEGYTNFLWVLYMAGFHLLPIPASKISLFIQISGAVFLLINLFFTKKIVEQISNNSTLAVTTALLLTASYLPLNNWSFQGMEVSLLTLIISMSTWLALQSLHSRRVLPSLYILLGLGTLVRPDMVVPFLTFLLFLLIADRENRKQQAIVGFSALAFFLLGQTAFRWFYYGDILPNTYYLKMTGYPTVLRVSRGFFVFSDFVFRMNLIVFLLPIGIVLARRDIRMILLLTVFLMQIAYSIYVGGDAWEWWGGSNRYLSIAMPLFFALFSCGVDYLRKVWENHRRQAGDGTPSATVQMQTKFLIGTIVFLSIINVNAIRGPESLIQWLLLSKPLYADHNKTAVEVGQLIKGITREKAKVGVVWAGTAPYYMDRYVIDFLGKNDREIAHESMYLPPADANAFTFFFPGHLKYNYRYSIAQLKPDIITELWGGEEQANPYLNLSYRKTVLSGFTLYLRKDSSEILWDRVERLAKTK